MSMSTKDKKIHAYTVSFFDKHVKKIEYTFSGLKEAVMFQVGMKKKGYDTNLTRVEL
jgi:hypothetical protein